MADFLRITGVNKTFQPSKKIRVHALHDIHLTVERGDLAVLSGLSGSGKTTLLNIIGGLDSPDQQRTSSKGNKSCPAFHPAQRNPVHSLAPAQCLDDKFRSSGIFLRSIFPCHCLFPRHCMQPDIHPLPIPLGADHYPLVNRSGLGYFSRR